MKDKNGIIHCKTPQEFNRIIGVKTYHPLISVVNFSQIAEYSHPQGWKQDYYVIALCRGNSSCGVKYGRNMYDYSDGTWSLPARDRRSFFRSTESRSGRQRTIGPSWCIPISSGGRHWGATSEITYSFRMNSTRRCTCRKRKSDMC